MTTWELHHPAALDFMGLLPDFISAEDPRKVGEQLDENYSHGGGWRPFGKGKWTYEGDNGYLQFPGDPAMLPVATTQIGDEKVRVYPHSIVLIEQKDGTFEVARCD